MDGTDTHSVEPPTAQVLLALLERQRAAARTEPFPTLAVRKDRLRRAIEALIANERRIVEACHTDFGNRHEALSLLTEVMAPVRSLRHALKNVERWMRPEKRRPEFPMGLIGARAYIFHQPLGVIGVVVPWNAPVALAYTPLAGILSAGNRTMIKLSEFVPTVSALTAEITRAAFDETEVAIVNGEVDVATAFTALPFDHLLFTGGAGTARAVMKAAATNLVPVTLELGGKSPAVVAQGADLGSAAGKIVFGKLANAGQVCMAPDFALVQRSDRDAFVEAVRTEMQRQFPDVSRNPDFTNVHLPRQRQRLAAMVEEAAREAAVVITLSGESIAELATTQRFPPVIVVDPPLDCRLMREEVFGPILPVVSYERLEDLPALLGSLSRPLAMYFLGGTRAQKDFMLRNTWAGGMSFDDIMLHPFMQDLPFGGVGESGMGRYLGFDGFKTFSNSKSVAEPPWIDAIKYLAPPYSPKLARLMRRALRF